MRTTQSSASALDAPARVGSRYARLDVLRALSAMLVMAHHFVYSGTWDMAPATSFFLNGQRGVLIFFVLSGFLVFRPFVAGPVPSGDYLVRRVARVMPAYVLALVGITLLSGERTFVDHPAQFLLFLQNYDPALFQEFIPVSWTLVLEMTFYVLVPVIAIVVLPIVGGHLRRGLTLMLVVGMISLLVSHAPGMSESGMRTFPAMLWAFVPGIGVAMLVTLRPDISARLASGPVAAFAALLVAIGWMAGGTPLLYLVADASLVVGIALMIPWLTRPRTAPEGRTIRHLAWFGVVISYPFYLWHMAVMRAVTRDGLTGPVAFGVTFVLVVLISWASYRAVELPAMRWAQARSRRGQQPATVSETTATGSLPAAWRPADGPQAT